jgi:hypothetical protein
VRPVAPTLPAPVSAPAAVIVEPKVLPVPALVSPQPVPKQSSSTSTSQTELPADETTPQVETVKPAKVMEKPLPVPPPTVQPEPVPLEPVPAMPEKAQTAAMPSPDNANIQPAPAPTAVQGGLLVDGGLDATWQALLPAVDALGIKLQSSDPAQHMLTTQWIDAMYDKKNQQFTLESNSKDEPLWAFNLWGKGHERHRFQLILLPVDGGARTMVYAYHTGFQEEADRTPDSSQTLLYWKDHKTEPAIAMAFLRRLQLVVKQ